MIDYGKSNEEMYRRAMTGVSLGDRMRKCLIWDMQFYSEYLYIDELVPEQEANKADNDGVLRIPTFVMLHMLFVLTHHRLGDAVRSQRSLQDLHMFHVHMYVRDISWQILGICQQISGDYVGALNSFRRSLQQYPYNRIQKATRLRIQTINEQG